MALFAKATILLNELVLIVCLVYLHKCNMKGGKYWREKRAADKNQSSIKKNVKSGQGMYHTRFSPSAAGWPSKILPTDLSRYQTFRSPCNHPCSPPGSTWGILRNEFHWLWCRKCDKSGWRGVNEASQVMTSRAFWEQDRDQAAPVFLSLLLNGMLK